MSSPATPGSQNCLGFILIPELDHAPALALITSNPPPFAPSPYESSRLKKYVPGALKINGLGVPSVSDVSPSLTGFHEPTLPLGSL